MCTTTVSTPPKINVEHENHSLDSKIIQTYMCGFRARC